MYSMVWMWCVVCAIAFIVAATGARAMSVLMMMSGMVVAMAAMVILIIRVLGGWEYEQSS